jgi:hypothetical protein
LNRAQTSGFVDIFLESEKIGRTDDMRQFHYLPPFIPSVAPYGTWFGGEDMNGCNFIFLCNGNRRVLGNFSLNIAGKLEGKAFFQKIKIRFARDHARDAMPPRLRFDACLQYTAPGCMVQGSWYPLGLIKLRHPRFARWQDKKLRLVERFLP